MKTVQKLMWGEGLFLKPQHFQRQDLYHEQRLASGLRAAHACLWGVSSMKVDREALESGLLRLLEIRAIMQDGEQIDAPYADPLPEARALADLDIPADGLVFHLALPLLRPEGGNSAGAGTRQVAASRYVLDSEPAGDLYTNAVEGELTVLRKQLRVLADYEPREQYLSFALLRIRKTASGGFEADASFLPPCISIASSPVLTGLLRRLMDMLEAKCEALYGHHREPSRNVIEFRSGDVASFWLLHTASSGFAELSHYFHQPALHPERLFQSLLRLAGQLLTFSKAYSLSDLPAYRHQDPLAGFMALDRIIRELIDTVISARYVGVALSELKPGLFNGRLESEKLGANARFYLSVGSDMPPAELVEAVPMRLKLGAPEDVDKLVLSSMPGIKLMAAPQVPAAIPVRPGCYYFSVEPHGPIYERMLQAQSIAIYVPSGFKDLKLELMAVIE
ncbi:type VI secretion system baseplate subunit TssK [Uliginosibacterium paludis]|uniref:Type VI secretion system baseplate subunit TssK n=1 Tax=Uliginosibacterium paludis TaxID=1615952 RepID=A0ABV2CQ56_9RHOO